MATIRDLYYAKGSPADFSTLRKLRAAEVAESKTKKGKPQTVGSTKAWLEEQDAYTLHRPVRKRFARNPYTVTKVGDVWECDLLDYSPTQNTMIISDTFYPSLMYSRNFYIWSPWRQIADLRSPRRFGPYLTISRNYLRGDPYEYARIRARNFSIKIFRTCYATRAYSFKCAGTPTWNVRSWNVLNARFVTDYTINLRIIIRSAISTSCRNLSGVKMTRFTRRQVWHPHV